MFKNSVTCVPNVGKFRLVNNDPNDELEVLSVESTDPKHFHPTIVQVRGQAGMETRARLE